MIKMASGVAARAAGPRGLMWAAITAAAAAVPAAFWAYGASVPLIVWLLLNGVMLLVSAIVCSVSCGVGDFDWRDIDHPLVMWALLAEWSDSDRPSWLRLIIWALLMPAEIAATIVFRPITLVVRALLKPMPGEWD